MAMDPCDSLKYRSLPDFASAVECIKELRSSVENNRIMIDSLESENSILQSDICTLALDAKDRDPNSFAASLADDTCPRPRSPKTIPQIK
jgi:hypothetical protein